MILENSNITKDKKCVDVFNAHLLQDVDYDGKIEIPFIKNGKTIIPKRLISYEKITNFDFIEGDFIHFYIDDYKFDGPKGIWNTLKYKLVNKRGFDIHKFDKCTGIISPDYSLYNDMPLIMQMWNTYRSRTVGHYLQISGYNVIPNVRWTNKESYDFAFLGLEIGCVVSISTLGCCKNHNDRVIFINGFIEMIKRIKPSFVLIYGIIFYELNYILKEYNIKFKNYSSQISLCFSGE